MKNFSAAIVLASLFVSAPALAIINSLDNVPAATLLLPHFDVDVSNANGTRTTFTIGNSSATPKLVNVQLWSDLGVPTMVFNVGLNGYEIREIDLRSIFVNGTIPSSTSGFPNCSAFLPQPNLSAVLRGELVKAHRGLAADVINDPPSLNRCWGSVQSDSHVRGYVTVDAVNTCNSLFTISTGYFISGGLGIASNENVLWGEYSISNATTGSAYGDTLVHVEASDTNPLTTTIGLHTFYGRLAGVSGTANDNREALPQSYFARYQLQGAIDGTKALVWRDTDRRAPFVCSSPPPSLGNEGIVVFDHQEEPASSLAAVKVPKASQLVDLENTAVASIPFTQGFVWYELGNPNAVSSGIFLSPQLNQAYVSHIMTSSTTQAGQGSAWPLWPLGQSFAPFAFGSFVECSDGLDNDGDGAIDFPADTSCPNATWPSERSECADGINNDADGLTDFPLDPGCKSLIDLSEEDAFDNQCGDGINNNDGDSLIDFPTDTGCSNFNDLTERRGNACDNGLDDDGDLLIDFPADPGCSSLTDNTETPPQCSDGLDNDGDTRIDFPSDPGCISATDDNEINDACNDGLDNDGDTFIDFPADIGCSSLVDPSENNPQCNDGIDNDGDTFIDFPADIGCASLTADRERTECSDGFDNDFDSFTDFPTDPQCLSASDNSETILNALAQCSDTIDNNGDGRVDFPNDANCSSPNDDFEIAECADNNQDNDLDGLADFGGGASNDPGCTSATDQNELANSLRRQCSDGFDNDGDNFADFPQDTGCTSANDDVEFTPNQVVGLLNRDVPSLNTWGALVMLLSLGLIGLGFGRRRGLV